MPAPCCPEYMKRLLSSYCIIVYTAVARRCVARLRYRIGRPEVAARRGDVRGRGSCGAASGLVARARVGLPARALRGGPRADQSAGSSSSIESGLPARGRGGPRALDAAGAAATAHDARRSGGRCRLAAPPTSAPEAEARRRAERSPSEGRRLRGAPLSPVGRTCSAVASTGRSAGPLPSISAAKAAVLAPTPSASGRPQSSFSAATRHGEFGASALSMKSTHLCTRDAPSRAVSSLTGGSPAGARACRLKAAHRYCLLLARRGVRRRREVVDVTRRRAHSLVRDELPPEPLVHQ